MERFLYKQSNRKNLQYFTLIFFLLLLSIVPQISLADNLYGGTCGNITCSQNEVCQKQYRGVLPIGGQIDTDSATYTCVRPEPIDAPRSPYRGNTGCSNAVPGGGFLGSTVNRVLGSTINTSLNNFTGNFLGNLISPFGFNLDGTLTGVLSDPIGNFTGDFNDLIGLGNLLEDCNYNNINGVIDSRRLIAPLPVDLFNPLPLPVNVTSPNPLPVVVVDDLALYQQKELIDAPLAAQQKAETISRVSYNLRETISNNNLIPKNYFDLTKLGIQFGALDTETGVVSREALDTYGGYANFSLEKNEQIAQYFRDRQDQKTLLPQETFSEKCGNIKIEEATTLECITEGLKTTNNSNDIAAQIAILANLKSEEATNLFDKEVRDGEGYWAKTINQEFNPFTKEIVTPGSNIASLSEKINEATIDQAILASGDNCFEAIPQNILDGTLKPILTDGLYRVNDTLAFSLNNAAGDPTNTLQNPQIFADRLQAGITGAIPDPDDFLRSLQDAAINNVTGALSCELNKQLSGLLGGVLRGIIPGDIVVDEVDRIIR
jgi:hypothetical protein